MKLLEIIEQMDNSKRIRRDKWPGLYLVRSLYVNKPLVLIDLGSLMIDEYCFSYEDLVTDDWSIC